MEGTWDIEVIDALQVRDSDYVLDKPRMDAFYNTSLQVLLNGLNVRKIALSGVVSNACVETTARSAAMRDFDVTVISDCCTTLSSADQAAAMGALQKFGFATVVTSEDLLPR
ncbi:cysteine hydrolase [Nocardia sp. NPDC050799]|uniref:cysteine hydrolase n=1 Tax=Nocardia sp. NPDC050799 TaxID=3154842 RepID=UPI0033F3A652